MPSFPTLPTPLANDTVELRLATERDIPEILIAHQDDPELYRRLRLERPPSGAELGTRTELASTERAGGLRLWLTIVIPDSDECKGQIDVHDADLPFGRADLDIWVVPQHRGRGLGTAALELAGRWLVGTHGIERLQLFIDPDNAPMLAAAAAAGFHREGLLRGYFSAGRRGRLDAEAWSLVRRDLAQTPRA